MDIPSGEFPKRFDAKKDELMSAYERLLTLSFASNCVRSCLSPIFLKFLAITSFIQHHQRDTRGLEKIREAVKAHMQTDLRHMELVWSLLTVTKFGPAT